MTRRSRLLASAADTRHLATSGQIPDISNLPTRVDRKTGSELVTHFFFPLSPRTLEAWPLIWRHVNGKALCEVVELFAMAQAKLDAAPMTRGERRSRYGTA